MSRRRVSRDQLPLGFIKNADADLERMIEARVAARAEADALRWRFRLVIIESVMIASLVLTAGALESRRQYDDGIIRSSGERPHARAIPNVFVLHLTLQRGQLIGWSVGLFLAGLAFGSMTTSLLDAAQQNELLARLPADMEDTP